MKKMFLIAAALFAAFCFASCSNPAGGSGDSGGQVSGGTTGGQTNGGEPTNNGGQQGGESQNETTVTGVDFFLENYKYSLNVGQTVRIASQMQSYTTPRAVIKVETADSSIVSISGNQSQGFFMTGVSSGKTYVKAFESENEHDYLICDVTVTGSSSGGGSAQNTLTDFLIGAWTHYNPGTFGTSSGTMTLNANKTGHITAYLKGSVVHDNDFTWTAYETRDAHNKLIKILSISGTGSSSGAIDGDHTITTGTSSFTMNCNFGFGMPNPSEWTKQ